MQTNLPSFRATLYRNIQRSYADFGMFAEQIAYRNPQSERWPILPADNLRMMQSNKYQIVVRSYRTRSTSPTNLSNY